ncbi:MAG: hypothetical protein JKY45_13315 [Emcibacter sp.]|nr:hypothetical protein [Emcibacter sp.]
MYNNLEKLFLIIPCIVLASCTDHDPSSRPSLEAGAEWDRMAVERENPMPVGGYGKETDSRENLSDMLPVKRTAPLSITEAEAYRTTLQTAAQKYKNISRSLESDFVAIAKRHDGDQKNEWRALQLQLSRLTNLHRMVDQAINALGNMGAGFVEDMKPQTNSLNQNRELLADIAEYVIHTRRRLDGLTPSYE